MTSFFAIFPFHSDRDFMLRLILDEIWQDSEPGALGGVGGRCWIVTSQRTHRQEVKLIYLETHSTELAQTNKMHQFEICNLQEIAMSEVT